METIKGFKDYTGEEASKRTVIRKIIEETFQSYGFEPAETPVIEYEEFVRGADTESENDEAVSDIFKLKDRGNRNLALRYELTFPLKRIMQNKKLPYKRYQIGPVFRDEPTQSDRRVRQFIALDADIIGSSIKDDAEILALINSILKKLEIKSTIYINNRKLMNELLDQYGVEDKSKPWAIRLIDKLDKSPASEIKKELKPLKAEKIIDILTNEKESFFKQFKSYSEISELKKYCTLYGIKVKFQPSLARGLSYYNGTVFEVKTDKLKESIFGGGSFNFNGIQSVGFGTSLERISSLYQQKSEKENYVLISIGEDKVTISLAEKLRKQGIPTSIFYGKISKALEFANSYNYTKVIFIGKEEVKKKKFKVKDMTTGKESWKTEKQILEKR